MGDPFNNGLTDNATWMTWQHAERRFLRWASPDCSATKAHIRIEATSPVDGQIAVLVDGSEAAQVKVVSSENAQFEIEVALPPTRSAHTVEFVPNGDVSVNAISSFKLF